MNQAQAIPRFILYDQLLALPENQVGEIIGVDFTPSHALRDLMQRRNRPST
jgi:hypothetical protein